MTNFSTSSNSAEDIKAILPDDFVSTGKDIMASRHLTNKNQTLFFHLLKTIFQINGLKELAQLISNPHSNPIIRVHEEDRKKIITLLLITCGTHVIHIDYNVDLVKNLKVIMKSSGYLVEPIDFYNSILNLTYDGSVNPEKLIAKVQDLKYMANTLPGDSPNEQLIKSHVINSLKSISDDWTLDQTLDIVKLIANIFIEGLNKDKKLSNNQQQDKKNHHNHKRSNKSNTYPNNKNHNPL